MRDAQRKGAFMCVLRSERGGHAFAFVPLTQEELERRKKTFTRPKRPLKGVMAAYRASVSGAEKGALWMYN